MKLSRIKLRKMILKEMYAVYNDASHERVNSFAFKIAAQIEYYCKLQGLETLDNQDGSGSESILIYNKETEDTISILVSIADDGDVTLENVVTKEKHGWNYPPDDSMVGEDEASKIAMGVVDTCVDLISPAIEAYDDAQQSMLESLRRRKQRRIRR